MGSQVRVMSRPLHYKHALREIHFFRIVMKNKKARCLCRAFVFNIALLLLFHLFDDEIKISGIINQADLANAFIFFRHAAIVFHMIIIYIECDCIPGLFKPRMLASDILPLDLMPPISSGLARTSIIMIWRASL